MFVILDADWFVIAKEKYFKQLSFYCPALGASGLYTFTLPPHAAEYQPLLEKQARHSHGLIWHSKGEYYHDEVCHAFEEIFRRLKKRPSELQFYAKGLEKCRLLEQYVPEALNLDQTGCPTYKNLCHLPQTTLNKALIFGQWLESRT